VDKQLDLLQGTLDMLILKAVSLGPLHGYGVLLRIQQISKDRLEIQQGSLYPALYRLEHQGWITNEWGESEKQAQGQILPAPRGEETQIADRNRKLEPHGQRYGGNPGDEAGGSVPHWSRICSWLRATLGRSRMEREMDAELRFHMEAYAEARSVSAWRWARAQAR
jgi:PadR family transcriptional regulator